MKTRFDLRAFLYLFFLFFSFSLLITGTEGNDISSYILPIALILLGLYFGFLLFQIPICMKLGWYARGERMLHAALKRMESSPALIPLLFHLFVFQLQQGRLEPAAATLDRISSEQLPAEAQTVLDLNRAALLLAEERCTEALDIYLRYSVDEFPDKQQAVYLNNLAFTYYCLGIETENAIEIADRAFNLQRDPRFSKTLAGLLITSGSFDAAEAWCRYGLKRIGRAEYISRAWCHYLLAICLDRRGERAEARNSAERAYKLSPLETLNIRIRSLLDSLQAG